LVNFEDILISVKVLLFMTFCFILLLIFAIAMENYFPVPEPIDRYDEGFNAGLATHNETVNEYSKNYCEYTNLIRGIDSDSDNNYSYYKGYHNGYVRWFIENGTSICT